MFEGVQPKNLEPREFDELQRNKLGLYVYGLRDPRDKKIFYVGQGERNRVLSHFKEAENALNGGNVAEGSGSKIARILDIWGTSQDVEWIIIAHGLQNNETASYIESSVFNALGESQNGPSLNAITPPKSSLLLPEDIRLFSAEPVNPTTPFVRVFIFPIHNTMRTQELVYEATRAEWRVVPENRSTPAYAVGLKSGLSVGSYVVEAWNELGNGKCEFRGRADDALLNKNWSRIINRTLGYWQRGNYLIVSFDGRGNASFLRGSQDREPFSLIE